MGIKKNKTARDAKLLARGVIIEPGQGQKRVKVTYSHALSRANELLEEGRHFLAASILEQLGSQVVEDLELFIQLLDIYIDHKRFDKGKVYAETLLARFPGNSHALRVVAKYYQAANNIDRSFKLSKEAVALEPKNYVNHYELGLLNKSMGNSDAALACFYRALSLKPTNPMVIFQISRLKGSKADPAFLKKVESLVSSGRFKARNQALLHFSLAWLYEKSDIEKHFKHLKQGNRITGKDRAWDGDASKLRCENNIKLYQKPIVDEVRDCGDEDFRPIFIAAMPRSGTTLLEQMLGAHSGLYCVGENAPFENAQIAAAAQGNPLAIAQAMGGPLDGVENFEQNILDISKRYQSNMLVKAAKDRRVVDKSIGNFFMAGMILLAFPRAKIIHIQRHPLDLIYSCYQQYFALGHNYSFDLKAASQSYKIYQTEMAHWKTIFPENIITIKYEELVADNEAVLRSLLSFCELPWEDSCVNYRDKIGMINTASDGQVRASLNKGAIEKWRNVERYLQEAIEELGDYANYPAQ